MTKKTYNLLIKYNKEHLIEFIRSIENMPHVKYLGSDDLTLEDIEKWDKCYERWCMN